MKKMRKRVLLLALLLVFTETTLAFAGTYVYYGSRVSGMTRDLYEATEAALRSGNTEYEVEYTGSFTRNILDTLSCDYPELYWAEQIEMRLMREGYGRYFLRCTLFEDWPGARQTVSSYRSKANRVIRTLRKKARGKSAPAKARIALDYLAANCRYRKSKYDQSPYGALVKKNAVCAGYARAYKQLCDGLGIPCICVSGYYSSQPHMVNLVKIRGKWYYVDPTWCDTGKKASYNYFLLGMNRINFTLKTSNGITIPTLAGKSITKYK